MQEAVDKKQALKTLLQSDSFSSYIKGACMEPLLRDNSLITVSQEKRMHPGDILVYQDARGELVCHRYIGRFPGRDGWGYAAWPDNADKPDPLIQRFNLIGQVTAIDREPWQASSGDRLRAQFRFARYCLCRLKLIFMHRSGTHR